MFILRASKDPKKQLKNNHLAAHAQENHAKAGQQLEHELLPHQKSTKNCKRTLPNSQPREQALRRSHWGSYRQDLILILYVTYTICLNDLQRSRIINSQTQHT